MPVERLTPDRRRAQTRDHLLAAAAEVFASRGYHAATLDEVADVAGFSKGAVYSNFASKEDLFLALMRHRGEELVGAFGNAAAGAESPEDQLIALRGVYAGEHDRAEAWALWTEFTLYALRDDSLRRELAAASQTTHHLVVSLVEQQCDAANVDPPLTTEQLARVYAAIFQGLWQQQAIEPDAIDDDLFPAAVLFLRRAVEQLGTPRRAKPAPRRSS